MPIPANIGYEMIDVGVAFLKELPMRCSEVMHRNRLGFGNVEFCRQNLRGAVDKKRLSGSLFVERLNDFRREGMPSNSSMQRTTLWCPNRLPNCSKHAIIEK